MRSVLLLGILVLALMLSSCGGAAGSPASNSPSNAEAPTIFIGDSITAMWQFPSDWPVHNYVNRGVNGQTSAQMLARFANDVLAAKPRMVIILAGTNDVAQYINPKTTSNNIRQMEQSAKAAGISVVLCTIGCRFYSLVGIDCGCYCRGRTG